jgi:hypothetical protein
MPTPPPAWRRSGGQARSEVSADALALHASVFLPNPQTYSCPWSALDRDFSRQGADRAWSVGSVVSQTAFCPRRW